MKRVLFVCLGNICRSPLAEGLARRKAELAGLELQFDSAGTESYHVGRPPDPRACAVARDRGVPIDELRARQVSRADFARFDLILAADRTSLRVLEGLRPVQGGAELALLLEWADAVPADATGAEVPDPYYGDVADFVRVFELLDHALDALLPRAARA